MVKYKTRHKGYTLVELVMVLMILGVLAAGVPSASQAFRYQRKADLVSMHKILVASIDAWTADNSNPIQKPADINAVNSQGRRVYEYIGDRDILKQIKKGEKDPNDNIKGVFPKVTKEIELDDTKCIFEKGVLTTIGKGSEKLYYAVLSSGAVTKPDGSISIKDSDYATYVKKHIIIIGGNGKTGSDAEKGDDKYYSVDLSL